MRLALGARAAQQQAAQQAAAEGGARMRAPVNASWEDGFAAVSGVGPRVDAGRARCLAWATSLHTHTRLVWPFWWGSLRSATLNAPGIDAQTWLRQVLAAQQQSTAALLELLGQCQAAYVELLDSLAATEPGEEPHARAGGGGGGGEAARARLLREAEEAADRERAMRDEREALLEAFRCERGVLHA
jgi:hypothetical protein